MSSTTLTIPERNEACTALRDELFARVNGTDTHRMLKWHFRTSVVNARFLGPKETHIDDLIQYFLLSLVASAVGCAEKNIVEKLATMLEKYCLETVDFAIERPYVVPLVMLTGSLYSKRISNAKIFQVMKNLAVYDLVGILLLGERIYADGKTSRAGCSSCTIRDDGTCCVPRYNEHDTDNARYEMCLVSGRASGTLSSMLPCRRDIVDILMLLHHVCRAYFIALFTKGHKEADRFSLDTRFGLACDSFCGSISRSVMNDSRFPDFVTANQDELESVWASGDLVSNTVSGKGRIGPDIMHVRHLVDAIANSIHEEKCDSDKFGRDRIWYTRTAIKRRVSDLVEALWERNAFSQIAEIRAFVKYGCDGSEEDATAVCFEGETWSCDVAWTLSVVAGEAGVPEHQLAHLVNSGGTPYLVCAPGALEMIAQSTACVALRRGNFHDCTLMYPLVFSLIIGGWDVLKDKYCPRWTRLLRATITWLIRVSAGDESTVNRHGDVELLHVLEAEEKQFSTYSLVGQLVAIVAAMSRREGLYKGRVFLHSLLRLRTPCVFTRAAADALKVALSRFSRNKTYDILRSTLDVAIQSASDGSPVTLASTVSQETTILVNTTLWCFMLQSHDTISHVFDGICTGYSNSTVQNRGVLIKSTRNPVNPLVANDEIEFSDLARKIASVFSVDQDREALAARNACAVDMLWFLRSMELVYHGAGSHDATKIDDNVVSPNSLFSHATHGRVIACTKSCAVTGIPTTDAFFIADFPVSDTSNGITCSTCNRNKWLVRRFDPVQKPVLPLKSDMIMDVIIANRFGLPRRPPIKNTETTSSRAYGRKMASTAVRTRERERNKEDIIMAQLEASRKHEQQSELEEFEREMRGCSMQPMEIDVASLRTNIVP